MNPHGHLALALASPLVKSVSWNEAPSRRHELLERWSFEERLGASVDHALADRRILRPRRHETPFHELRLIAPLIANDHRHFLRGRDAVAGLKREIALEIPANLDLAEGERAKAAAHGARTNADARVCQSSLGGTLSLVIRWDQEQLVRIFLIRHIPGFWASD